MRLILVVAFLSSLFTNVLSCVVFSAVIEFYNSGANAGVSYSLADNGAQICSGYDAVTNPDDVDFIWLDCESGYSATFSWHGENPVSYARTGFEGTFTTTATYDGEPEFEVYYFTYTASVWGC